MQKKKVGIFIVVLVLIIVCGYVVFSYQHNKAYDGSTVKSRELLLNEAIAKQDGENWKIVTERKEDGYIISGAYSTNDKAAIAVFEPIEADKYKLMSSANRNNDEIIVENFLIKGEPYHAIWFHGAQTEHAEIIYTIDGQAQNAIKYDTSEMDIICDKAPAKEYTMNVSYYDSTGNKYE